MCIRATMNRNGRCSIIRLLLCLIWVLWVIACRGGDVGPGGGSIAISLSWIWSTDNNAVTGFGLCPQGISTITANVYNSMNILVASDQWQCGTYQGTMVDIPVGSGYYIIFEAQTSGGSVTWLGEVTNINVNAGAVTNGGTVIMHPVSEIVSIAVVPANFSISLGSSQQFAAIVTFDDNATNNLTPMVSWTSSDTNVASISAAGLANSAAVGSSTISAAFIGLSNSTTLKIINYSFTVIDGAQSTHMYGIDKTDQIAGDAGGHFTTIAVPNALNTFARGINDSGQIAGYYTDTNNRTHGFLYNGGIYTTIDVPTSSATYAYGINNAGQIVGRSDDPGYQMHGFLYRSGNFTKIDVPGADNTVLIGINDSGQISGYFDDVINTHGFLATPQ